MHQEPAQPPGRKQHPVIGPHVLRTIVIGRQRRHQRQVSAIGERRQAQPDQQRPEPPTPPPGNRRHATTDTTHIPTTAARRPSRSETLPHVSLPSPLKMLITPSAVPADIAADVFAISCSSGVASPIAVNPTLVPRKYTAQST